ncbi:MAG: hypothetical protein P8Y01_14820 [Woeseiaceae bacterium]
MGLKMHDQAFVAPKQAGQLRYRAFVDAEQIARYVACGDEIAGYGGVNAMVVVGREVKRCEAAVDETACVIQVGREQVIQRVLDILGLEQGLTANAAGAADGAVYRGKDRVSIVGQRPRAWREFADKEIIERLEFVRNLEPDFTEVDVEHTDKRFDEPVLHGRRAHPREAPDQRRHQVTRQHVLQHHESTIDHCPSPSG